MRTVAIVQARIGSTRLPGKVLLDVEGKSVLERTVERARLAHGIDEVTIATTTAIADSAVVHEAERIGVRCFRGSEQDVLTRYVGAARDFEADVVVRITSDCPLLDPGVTGEVVASLQQSLFYGTPADYCSNSLPRRTFPRGLDTEAMTREALERASARAKAAREREHVSVYLYEHPEEFTLLGYAGEVDHSQHRWTVDTAADLKLVRRIYQLLGDRRFDWRDVLALFELEPELFAINAQVQQKVA